MTSQSGRVAWLSIALVECIVVAGISGCLGTGPNADGGSDVGAAELGDVSGRRDAEVDLDAATDAGAVDADAGIVEYGRMIYIPGGPFAMGCSAPSPFSYCYEDGVDYCCGPAFEPTHLVDVPPVWIDETEVTVAAFAECVREGACLPHGGRACAYGQPGKENHPMDCVSSSEAEIFCLWAGKRMCTEAEWEKAARGGCEVNSQNCETRIYPWGNEQATCEHAAIFGFVVGAPPLVVECPAGSAPVGSHPSGASPYGVLDMVGNAHEPVEDCYHSSFDGAPTDGSAWLEDCNGPPRLWVAKGGSYETLSLQAVSYHRTPGLVDDDNCCGIRCCRTP